MAEILKHIDILDLVEVKVFELTPGNFQVVIDCLEGDRQLVFDPKALATLNAIITDKTTGLKACHENTIPFIKEFVSKMISEMYRSGLCELDEIKETGPKLKYKKSLPF